MSAAASRGAHLGLWPTPLHRPAGSEVYLKREDLCGFAFGGSKVRALEALLTVARQQRSTALVVGGRRDSNWVALAAIAAANLGLACHTVFDDGDGTTTSMRIAQHHGATVHHASPPGAEAVNHEISRIAGELGPGAFAIPRAGATAVGAYGYARTAREILHQLPPEVRDVDVVVALGSGGLAAGLLVGLLEAAGPDDGRDVRVVAVPVSKSEATARDVVARLVRSTETEGLSEIQPEAALALLDILPRQAGSDPTATATAMAGGVLLDPVFAGPAWHTYFAQRPATPRDVVLVASGGLPAVFDSMNGPHP